MANDISSMTLVSSMPSRPAKDPGQFATLDGAATTATAATAYAGKPLPVEGKALPQLPPVNDTNLREAVDQINNYIKVVQRDLSFSMDDDTGHTVIKVIDSASGELIRQIPSEEVLAIATYLQDVSQESEVSGEAAQGILFSDRT